jgi:hypothetical protein
MALLLWHIMKCDNMVILTIRIYTNITSKMDEMQERSLRWLSEAECTKPLLENHI